MLTININEKHKCDNSNSCFLCLDGLFQRNTRFLTDFIFDKSLPFFITQITLQVPPIENNLIKYFSLDGVDTIFYNFFKTTKREVIHDLRNGEVLFRVSLRGDRFYTLPTLVIEVYFLKKLDDFTIQFLNENINTLFLSNTLGTGSIKVLDKITIKRIEEMLRVDFVIGMEKFTKYSHSFFNSYSDRQIDEINYLLDIQTKRIDFRSLLNNPLMSLFQEKKRVLNWS